MEERSKSAIEWLEQEDDNGTAFKFKVASLTIVAVAFLPSVFIM